MSLLVCFLLVNVFTVFYPSYMFLFGGFAFLPHDLVYLLMILKIGRYALTRPTSTAKLIRENFFLTVFLAVVAVYVALYTPVHGQSAIGEARKDYFIFFIPLVALVSIKQPEDLRRFVFAIIFSATCVAFVALGLGAMQGSIIRILSGEGTLIVALAAFSLAVHRIHRLVVINPIVDTILLLLFSAIIVTSAQRSVWLGVGFGLLLLMWLYHNRPALVTKMALVAGIGVLGLFIASFSFPEVESRLAEKFAGIIDPSDDETAAWRMEGWRQQLTRLVQEGHVLFGEGVGGYYHWNFNTVTWTSVPHNAYVQIVLKFGLFGLTLYGLLALEFFRKTLAVRKKLRPGPMRACIEMGILNFGAAHVFMLGYGFNPIMLMFFAVATSAASLSQQALRHSRDAEMKRCQQDPKIPPPRRFPPHRRPGARPLYS